MTNLGRAGFIGRFKPLHNGGALVLEAICEQAVHVTIGIGSSNKYNLRNPFTAEESKGMIDSLLSGRFSNYSVVYLPDYGHIPEYRDGKKWADETLSVFGTIDTFVSGNPYVKDLLLPHYKVIDSYALIPEDKQVYVSGTMVRVEMAKGDLWKQLVPPPVADYLEKNRLVERFRKEFGLMTLAGIGAGYCISKETERIHVREV